MVRWCLCHSFSDFPILNDFFMVKVEETPISLRNHVLKYIFSDTVHGNHTKKVSWKVAIYLMFGYYEQNSRENATDWGCHLYTIFSSHQQRKRLDKCVFKHPPLSCQNCSAHHHTINWQTDKIVSFKVSWQFILTGLEKRMCRNKIQVRDALSKPHKTKPTLPITRVINFQEFKLYFMRASSLHKNTIWKKNW